ncbi:MAG: rhodanese-related sulfurtransferase [Alphaproteobacteria bacterium]|nr:rhodanese-related sulfurtransferase [Alphaproteobacteria bacterium]
MMLHSVISFYKFVKINNPKKLRKSLLDILLNEDVVGTFLIAKEGINATVSGSNISLKKIMKFLDKQKGFNDIEYKHSCSIKRVFKRLKIKVKDEIVALGKKEIDPSKTTRNYIEPRNWNKLIADPDVLLIDTRNTYEIKIGTFLGAENPNIKNFRDFPNFVKKKLNSKKNQKIAMFCTGGIRCEKASSYLLEKGFKDVYQLKGGILKYLEQNTKKNSRFKGECFVFDERVSVNKKLKNGRYQQCYACRMPISKDDISSIHYKKGISCPHCFSKTSKRQKNRFAERQNQINLSFLKNIDHFSSQT